jgi:hypothetical protein
MTLTNQETTAILVGLRLLQHTNIPGTSIYNIPATLPGQGVVRVGLPLTAEEIDDLCERINCGETA